MSPEMDQVEQLIAYHAPRIRRMVEQGRRPESVRDSLRLLAFRCSRHASRAGIPDAEIRARLLALAAGVDVYGATTAVMAGLRRANSVKRRAHSEPGAVP